MDTLNIESAVSNRYADAAKAVEPSLCCPTSYDPRYLAAIPKEVLERDYGCGDPSTHLKAGETVLDLGSGTGKICFIASQVVGPSGRVIGVDMTDEMLAVARTSAPVVAAKVGYGNVEFRKGRIQDLALDVDKVDRWLKANPVGSAEALAGLEAELERLRQHEPLVPSASVDVVVSNCVLNLVKPGDKLRLFAEIHRVLRPGGRAVISDIVSDEDVPEKLQRDPELWSGCISGALREDSFLEAFEQARFYGITLAVRGEAPWRTVEGIEFRSVTVVAYKGKEGDRLEQKHAVIYKGPFRQVTDDSCNVLRRGVPTAVCEKTFRLFSREPYRAHIEPVPPKVLIPLEQAQPFTLKGPQRREPKETKGEEYRLTTADPGSACGPGGDCC